MRYFDNYINVFVYRRLKVRCFSRRGSRLFYNNYPVSGCSVANVWTASIGQVVTRPGRPINPIPEALHAFSFHSRFSYTLSGSRVRTPEERSRLFPRESRPLGIQTHARRHETHSIRVIIYFLFLYFFNTSLFRFFSSESSMNGRDDDNVAA